MGREAGTPGSKGHNATVQREAGWATSAISRRLMKHSLGLFRSHVVSDHVDNIRIDPFIEFSREKHWRGAQFLVGSRSEYVGFPLFQSMSRIQEPWPLLVLGVVMIDAFGER